MRHAGFALVAALAAAAPSPKPPAPRPLAPPRVGFIWHFPFVDVGTAQVAGSGATSMIARVPWVVAQPGPDRWDMGSLDRQISEAERGGFSLVLLLECNPFCAPKWLRDQVAAAGESVRDASGVAGDVPSSASEVFARAQRRFVETVIAAVRTRDRHPVITHYQVGVEWWFPYEQRHAPAHIAAFRAWLARRYRTVSGVNRAWGSAFASFAEVTAPRTHVTGRMWEKGRSGLIPVLSQDAPDAPTGGPGASHDWAMFWHETAAGYINSLAAMARRLDPSRPTMSFLTMSFAQGAEWDYVDWSAIRLDEVCARARDITEIGMQLPAARGDAFRIAVGLDIARKYRKPMSVLDLLDFTDGVKAGRAVHDRATHTAIQHGASSLYYCCWNGAKDFSFHPDWPEDELRAMLTDARRTLDLVEGMTVVADGAIVLPIMPGVPGTEDARSRSATSFMGWYKLLERLHRTVDVITLWEIERGLDLSRYRWVVLPDCEIALKGAASRLNGFARSRRLILGGTAPSRDEHGKAIAHTWPGAVRTRDFGGEYAGKLTRDAAAGDTPPMVMWRAETPEHGALLAEVRDALGSRMSP
ncbi:MAG: hypothetical protein FJX72_18535, partial [Armatimonadetes bacterium]|nr:hypothetical protein [Armatimonadota bacterium]